MMGAALSTREPELGNDPLILGPERADAFLRTVEAAPSIRRRHQYFMWTQRQLQILLPHQVLVCSSYVRRKRALEFEVFHSIALPAEALAALSDAQGPLLRAIVGAWVQANGAPLSLSLERLRDAAAQPAVRVLQSQNIDELLVHGVARPQRPAEIECLFIFADPGRPQGPAVHGLAELLVPYLHWIWQRVMATESELALTSPMPVAALLGEDDTSQKRLTFRERQVLEWVRDGKSNHEIGQLLAISPLTVKNHIQKILRRLGCSNRTQAVAEAIATGLLPGATPR